MSVRLVPPPAPRPAGGPRPAPPRRPTTAEELSWDDLRVALAVSRAGSLARAAEALGVDPATVSRRLAALEGALGTTLFARTNAGVAATTLGEIVLARAAEIEARATRLQDELAAGGAPAGVVRVCGGAWVMARVAGPGAAALRAAHPGIELRLVTGRAPIELAGGEASLALWFEAPPRPGEFSIPLGEVPYAVYAPAGAGPDAPRLAHRNEDGPTRAPDRWAQAGRTPGGAGFALCASDSLLLHAAARAGVGAALLPMCLGEGDPALVRAGPGAAPALTRTLYLHAHPDTVQFARVQAVVGALRGAFDRLFGAAPAPAGAAAPPARARPGPGAAR